LKEKEKEKKKEKKKVPAVWKIDLFSK